MNPHVDKIWVGCCTRLHPNHPSPDSPDNQTWQGWKIPYNRCFNGPLPRLISGGYIFFLNDCVSSCLTSEQWADLTSWHISACYCLVGEWDSARLCWFISEWSFDVAQTSTNTKKHQQTSIYIQTFMTFQYIRQSQHSLTNHLIPKRFFLPSRHVGARPLPWRRCSPRATTWFAPPATWSCCEPRRENIATGRRYWKRRTRGLNRHGGFGPSRQILLYIYNIYGDGSKPWYLVKPKFLVNGCSSH